MAINVISPNISSYLKTISSSGALGETGSSSTNFSKLLSAVLSGSDGTVTNSISSILDSYANTSTGVTGSVNLDDIFQKAADTYNVPVDLLKAVGKAESNFDPTSKSSAGAMGIMQLMPKTAASLGVTDAFDPYQNIMGGAKYLSQMLEQVNGNVEVALAAYNAGPGNVQKYGGIPPFEETHNYIAKVMDYCSDNLTAGIVSGSTSSSGLTGSESLSELSAKDLSTMMTLYRYQTELSILSAVSDNEESKDASSNLFSTEMMNML